MNRIARLASFALALSPWCAGAVGSAQGVVHVVDVAAGPGADFTSIRVAAQSAASGDVLLIRGGSYDESALVFGKSLTLQAEAGAAVYLNEGLRILSTAPTQVVAVRGLFVSNGGQLGGRPLEVLSCQGPVWLEDSTFQENHFSFNVGTRVSGSASVTFTRCTLDAPGGRANFPGIPITLEVDGSHVTLLSTRVEGLGGAATPIGTPGPGGPAAQLIGSTLVASNTAIVGGVGGNYTGAPATCADGGPGGGGLLLAASSTATLFATSVLGGAGGTTLGACSPGATGVPFDLEPGSSVSQDPRGLGQLVVTSPVRELTSFTTVATAEPGAPAWVLYAQTAIPALSSPAFEGDLLVSTSPFLFLYLGVLPASGMRTTTLAIGQLSPGVLGMPFYAQLMTFSPTDARFRLGDTTLMTLLDSTL